MVRTESAENIIAEIVHAVPSGRLIGSVTGTPEIEAAYDAGIKAAATFAADMIIQELKVKGEQREEIAALKREIEYFDVDMPEGVCTIHLDDRASAHGEFREWVAQSTGRGATKNHTVKNARNPQRAVAALAHKLQGDHRMAITIVARVPKHRWSDEFRKGGAGTFNVHGKAMATVEPKPTGFGPTLRRLYQVVPFTGYGWRIEKAGGSYLATIWQGEGDDTKVIAECTGSSSDEAEAGAVAMWDEWWRSQDHPIDDKASIR